MGPQRHHSHPRLCPTAGLPHIKGLLGDDQLIVSHDFVEASLLRRAGWRVRFLPRIAGSFEETPGTLIDYVLRDHRWCRGNLQHLRLLGTRGLHLVSRLHMFQGAAAYLMSPAWFILLLFWALLGREADTNVINYFNETNPLFPKRPPEMSHIDSTVFLFIMYAMLLTPKLAGAGIIATNGKAVHLFGRRRAFLGAFFVEVALSILYALIFMIQQTRAVLRAAFGRADGWAQQQRDAHAYQLSLDGNGVRRIAGRWTCGRLDLSLAAAYYLQLGACGAAFSPKCSATGPCACGYSHGQPKFTA